MGRTLYLVLMLLTGFCFVSCTYHEVKTESKVEVAPVEIKPIHIIVDVNVKIQQELKQKFENTDNLSKEISDAEAEATLQKYLNSNK